MSTLTKYVRADGTGDYTSISVAFNDMLASGLAATGDITEYYMYVDDNDYTTSITGTISSGEIFNIIGSGTLWDGVSQIYNVSGYSENTSTSNLIIKNMTFVGNTLGTKTRVNLLLENCEIIGNNPSFTLKDQALTLNNINLCKSNASVGTAINVTKASGTINITNSIISRIQYLIYAFYHVDVNIDNSKIFNVTNSIIAPNSTFNVSVNNLLSYSKFGYFLNSSSGNVYIDNSTLVNYDENIYALLWNQSSNNTFKINKSILMDYNNAPLFGTVKDGSWVKNCCIVTTGTYPLGWSDSDISGYNNIYTEPLFNDVNNYDFRLQYKEFDGSACVEFQNTNQYPSDVNISLDQSSLKIYDENGKSELYRFLPYIYKQGSSIILSDYNKEIQFAKDKAKFKNLKYNLLTTAEFSETGVLTEASFDKDVNKPDSKPYDWDYKHFQTTRIGYNESYVVPRSYISLPEILIQKLGVDTDDVLYQDITKQHIKVYEKQRYRGVAYDYTLSKPTEAVIWIVNGNNQSLIKQNSFTGEELNEYPLLCPTATKTHIKLSGVVYVGVDGDSYKYRNFNNPNEILLSENNQGFFQWICPDINTKYDIRGIVSNKDYIYITASDYQTQDILNRSSIPSGQPIGKVLWYNNNDLFYNYTKKPNETNGPLESNLAPGNYYPTDITVYEDGSLMIADYHSASGIYKYKRTYDYALVTSSYDDGSRILLRENYNDINI